MSAATFQRPEGLVRLLGSLVVACDRALLDGALTSDDMRVLIVDNDAARSGEQACQLFASRLPNFDYRLEKQPGLGYVRNHALDVAERQGCCCVVFVDDDEQVDDCWLVAFTQEHSRFPQALLFGPVLGHLPSAESVSDWFNISAGRLAYRDGPLNREQTLRMGDGNTLLPSSIVDSLRYRPQFAATGSQDTDLFARHLARGGTARFINSARVTETVQPARNSRRYAVSHAMVNGRNKARIDVDSRGSTQFLWGLAALLKALLLGALGGQRGLGGSRLRIAWMSWQIRVAWCLGYMQEVARVGRSRTTT